MNRLKHTDGKLKTVEEGQGRKNSSRSGTAGSGTGTGGVQKEIHKHLPQYGGVSDGNSRGRGVDRIFAVSDLQDLRELYVSDDQRGRDRGIH